MTNERASANDTPLSKIKSMGKPLPKTLPGLQQEAMQTQALINVAMGYSDPEDLDKMVHVLDLAMEHANRLNSALDSVNAPSLEKSA
ncbi:MAG: hypothetical protein AAGI03_04730 [Pseudomonadota bacterium]